MGERRRAHSDEYAARVNRAVALLGELTAAEAVRVLQVEHGLSERQARRYVGAARRSPCGVTVPERTAVFTVRLPGSLIARLRGLARSSGRSVSATAAEALTRGLGDAARESERGGGAAR